MEEEVERLKGEAERNRRENATLSRLCDTHLRSARSGRLKAEGVRVAVARERERIEARLRDLEAQEGDVRAFLDVKDRVRETEVEGGSVVFTTEGRERKRKGKKGRKKG